MSKAKAKTEAKPKPKKKATKPKKPAEDTGEDGQLPSDEDSVFSVNGDDDDENVWDPLA